MEPAILIIILFPVVFIIMWLFITWILAQLGWKTLTRLYKSDVKMVDGTAIPYIGGKIKGVNYNATLDLHATPEGFYLKPIPVFKAFHPTLFIPWDEVSKVNRQKLVFVEYYILFIGKDVSVASLRLKPKQFQIIQSYLPFKN